MQPNRDASLARSSSSFDLVEHPFYRAWSDGTLPVEKLALYASEYGNFIRGIPDAWWAIGEEEVAATEVAHAGLWDEFTRSIGAPVRAASVPAVAQLCATFERMARTPETAAGALFAFEAQQPNVARSKLHGIERHYRTIVPDVSVAYFKAHLDDYAEPALLRSRVAAMDAGKRRRAEEAAVAMGKALWGALDGIMTN